MCVSDVCQRTVLHAECRYQGLRRHSGSSDLPQRTRVPLLAAPSSTRSHSGPIPHGGQVSTPPQNILTRARHETRSV